MNLSIIIPTNNPDLLNFTLESLQQKTEFDYEVIVVENPAHTDYVQDLCERYKAIHIVVNEIGANHARNEGVKVAKGEILGFLDDDVICSEDWVNRTILLHKLYPNSNLVGGPVELSFSSGKPPWLEGDFLKTLAEVKWPSRGIDLVSSSEHYIVSANMSMRRTCYNLIEGFDDRIGHKAELNFGNDELEFNRVAIATGGFLYDRDLSVKHIVRKERTSLDWFQKRYYNQGVSDAKDALRKGKPETDIYHDIVQHHALNFITMEETNKVRNKVCNENFTRQYIKNYVICKTSYMSGLIKTLINKENNAT